MDFPLYIGIVSLRFLHVLCYPFFPLVPLHWLMMKTREALFCTSLVFGFLCSNMFSVQ